MSGAFKMVAIGAISGIAAAAMMTSSVQAGPQIVVRVGDLDLSRPQDVKEFDHRMDLAAHLLCQQIYFIGTRVPKLSACRTDVREEAKEALDGGMPQFVAVARTAKPEGF
ncbi:MAG: UrcA family protein [Caulobacteraceae bacterium]|nr:UrcA family protein [Caulobacteraceae bacterium]